MRIGDDMGIVLRNTQVDKRVDPNVNQISLAELDSLLSVSGSLLIYGGFAFVFFRVCVQGVGCIQGPDTRDVEFLGFCVLQTHKMWSAWDFV